MDAKLPKTPLLPVTVFPFIAALDVILLPALIVSDAAKDTADIAPALERAFEFILTAWEAGKVAH